MDFFKRQNTIFKKPLFNQFAGFVKLFGYTVGFSVFVGGNKRNGAVGVINNFIADDFIVFIGAFGAQIAVGRIDFANTV